MSIMWMKLLSFITVYLAMKSCLEANTGATLTFDMEAFCKDAGFMDGKCKLDCVWMTHPYVHLNIELFHYYEPNVTTHLLKNEIPKTQDVGGIKHISYVVENTDRAFAFLKAQPGVTMISENPLYHPIQMSPLPFKFFYWLDPYGVQWECEEGDKVVTYKIAGLTRLMDEYVEN